MAPGRGSAVDVGIGVRELTRVRGTGEVIATYAKAAYVRCAGGVLALTSPEAAPGPIHLRCRTLPAVTVGEPVSLDAASIAGRDWAVDLAAPTRQSTLPARAAFVPAADFALTMLAPVPPAVLLDGPVPAVWPAYAEVLGAGDLRQAAEALGGRGSGLTPAGDDVLAGLVLAAAALWGPGHAAELTAAVALARTNDIAAGFLHWAGRGQSIAPVHDFLHAAARLDAVGARQALRELRSFGASSGADLAYGLVLALRHLPRAPP